MKRIFAGLLALATATLPLGKAAGETITVKVSNSLLELNQQWAAAYQAKHPGVDLRIAGDETAAALPSLAEKKVDLVVIPRAIRFKEAQACEAVFGRRPTEFKVAVNGVAVYVHTNNLIQTLEYEELNNIFHGRTQNWKDLSGGKDQAIAVYVLSTNTFLGELFDAEVLEGMGFSARVHLLAGQEMLKAIAADPNAIGFGALTPFDGVQALSIKRAHSSTPVDPTEENIAHRIYPISRYVYAYGQPGANGDQAKAYLDWIRGEEGQQVAKAAGFYALPANLRPSQ